MDYLYSPYDALISINVPTDKTRAVVDAMERDMGTSLATKSDLLLIRQEMENRFGLVSRDNSRCLHRTSTKPHSGERTGSIRALFRCAVSLRTNLIS